MTWNKPRPWSDDLIQWADEPVARFAVLSEGNFWQEIRQDRLSAWEVKDSVRSFESVLEYQRAGTDIVTVGELAFVVSRFPKLFSGYYFRDETFATLGDFIMDDLEEFRQNAEPHSALAWKLFHLVSASTWKRMFGDAKLKTAAEVVTENNFTFDAFVKYTQENHLVTNIHPGIVVFDLDTSIVDSLREGASEQ